MNTVQVFGGRGGLGGDCTYGGGPRLLPPSLFGGGLGVNPSLTGGGLGVNPSLTGGGAGVNPSHF